jgi:hypothetical protein
MVGEHAPTILERPGNDDADDPHAATYYHAVSTDLPPCGLYRTVKAIGNIEAGRLVYFHNHGDPGPGVYFPESWNANRAKFSQQGSVLPANFDPKALRPLPVEGFYRVKSEFYCCEKNCVKFEPDAFVQLGYNGAGKALVFIPELAGNAIDIPQRGTFVEDKELANLVLLRLAERQPGTGGGGAEIDIKLPRGIVIH